MYRTVSLSYWTDPKIRALPEDGKLLMLYLVTNPHSHFSGIYYLARSIMAAETGLSTKRIDALCNTLSIGYLACFDVPAELVWVRNMLKHQGRGALVSVGVTRHLKTLHKSLLIKDFFDYYKALGYTLSIPYQYPTDTKEQDQNQIPEEESATESEEDSGAIAPFPFAAVIDVYHAALPTLPRFTMAEGTEGYADLLAKIGARTRGNKWTTEDDWAKYFFDVAGRPFLLGQNDRKWTADLPWLCGKLNMGKVLAGRYRDSNQPKSMAAEASRLVAERDARKATEVL